MHITNILLVDDDPDLLRVAQLSLRNVGHWNVQLARSGCEALAVARQSRPDLIVLDIMMPGMDGPQTLAALRQEPGCEQIPVIFLTAKVQPQDFHKYIKMGAVGVLIKPFDPMTLPDEIRQLLDEES